jgi:hypothetical protein
MKKKTIVEPIVSPRILALAKKSIEPERSAMTKPCAVCGAVCTPLNGPAVGQDENLCWVCRRLKISAWRDSDHQMAAQE